MGLLGEFYFGRGQQVVAVLDLYRNPTVCTTLETNSLQRIAIFESGVADCGEGVGESDLCQCGASREGAGRDLGDLVAQVQRGEGNAIAERLVTDGGEGGRQIQFVQLCAGEEGVVADC